MCERILSDVFDEKIPVKVLFEWLLRQKPQEAFESSCGPADFVSYFINYIHDAQSHIDRSADTPQKSSTPKRIHCERSHDGASRRSLFAEDKDENTPNPSTPNTKPLNDSYASPFSPIYNGSSVMHSSPRSPCLGDFLVQKSSKKKQKESAEKSKQSRRINPTNLLNKKFGSLQNSNSFTFPTGDETVDNSNGERSFLLQERMMVAKRTSDAVPSLSLPKACIKSRRREVIPCFKFVTCEKQLEKLVSVYSFMLDNFVLNLTSELNFIVLILIGREYESDWSPNSSLNLGVNFLDLSDENLLKIIHNRVYFAANVLQLQADLLQALDRPALRLLADNKRLQHFAPKFRSKILDMWEKKAVKVEEVPQQSLQSVCFISDTDNRDNFPNDSSFHAFRKQRDLFYETLRVWENNHLQEEWNFAVALGGKIKALLNMCPDVANLMHFARLFKSQLLLNSCCKSENEESEAQLGFLSCIANMDTEKLSRLKNRIVGKQAGTGINAVPIFTGYQEFYRDFLSVASNHLFNKHLNDAFISEIVELNNTKFTCADFEDSEECVDTSMRNSYIACVTSLRILAKFLGFLDSLPYKNDSNQPPQQIIASHLLIRSKVQPNIDLKEVLKAAQRNNTLILTIPWTTNYLAMLDYISLRLAYFKEVIQNLFEIYHGKHIRNNQNALLVRLCLGWLFELPHFPEDLYRIWFSQRSTKSPRTLKKGRLDELAIVDQTVLNICCPYVQEIKRTLSNDISSSNVSVTVKHITPLTSTQSASDMSNKRIQLQLEEAFFNGQPVSIRKTVEFVSERVASACVKEICNEIVPSFKKNSTINFKEILGNYDSPTEEDADKLKLVLQSTATEFASSALKELREKISEFLKCTTSHRISVAMGPLLAADVLEQTKEVCVTISNRTCLERVQQWVSSHVNLGIFLKESDVEIRNFLGKKHSKVKPVFALPEFGKDVVHDSDAPSGFHMVEHIRSCSWDLIENPAQVNADKLLELLERVRRSIRQRCDLNEYILILISSMLVDLMLLLVAHRPDVTRTILPNICSLWRECNCDDLFKLLICSRNLMILSRSLNVNETWRAFIVFIRILVRERLLTKEAFHCQVRSLDGQHVDKVTYLYLQDCLRSLNED